MINANIGVADGLANWAEGKLPHVQLGDQSRVLRVWLLFSNSVNVDARGKVAGYANVRGIGREMIPINHRFATVPLNRNRSIHAIRNHFPLKSACSSTIHKPQGGIFDEIVYKYSNSHSQHLVYAALSRVTAQECHIVPTDGHGRRNNETMLPLRNQFTRLSSIHLTTIDQIMINKTNGV
ncbi:ATP-dependent DNA helicase [Trichonephila clavipes]|nr:ATP-dependent DNA helicase [Trichonephila clavipes]